MDIVEVLTDSEDSRKYWNKLSQRLREEGSEVVTFCHRLKFLCLLRKVYKYCRHKIIMVYTEVRNIKGRKYYYRVISVRKGEKISKKRVYLGYELSEKDILHKEKEADEKLLGKKVKVNNEIDKIKSKINHILKENRVTKAGIFGSYSRGEQRKDSDVDIAVEINDKNMSLIGFIGLKLALEEILKKKVDLVEYSAIKPIIKERILSEEIRII